MGVKKNAALQTVLHHMLLATLRKKIITSKFSCSSAAFAEAQK